MIPRHLLRTRLPPLVAAAAFCAAVLVPAQTQSPGTFAHHIASLSEPGGYFDTDNLISNEASYAHVLSKLADRKIRGGAYIGVGPDQNFTYIAATRPSLAFIVDIRRDNMLLHLLFKALFELAPTRVAYLALLFGQNPPPDSAEWQRAPIERILSHVESRRSADAEIASVRARVDAALVRFGVALSDEDRHTIDRFHRRFVQAGTSLRFQSIGRTPRSYYPTYRDLLVARDSSGRGSFLAFEDGFQFVRDLQRRNLVVPVVGDVSGPKALGAIGQFLRDRNERLSTFYISNVEFYLFRDDRFQRYLANLGRVPHHQNAVIIRSVFGPYASSLGTDYSSSHVQAYDELLDRAKRGSINYYTDLLR